MLIICLLEVCLEPSISNGNIESSIEKTYRPGDNVSVICDAGFKADSLTTTCNASRYWDSQPVCTMVTCPAPGVDNGYYTTNSDILTPSKSHDTSRFQQCKRNHKIHVQYHGLYDMQWRVRSEWSHKVHVSSWWNVGEANVNVFKNRQHWYNWNEPWSVYTF